MISFKGAQYPKSVIKFAVFFYARYRVYYQALEEIMAERGASVCHTTLNLWVARYSNAIAEAMRRRKASRDRSWRIDEAYIKVALDGIEVAKMTRKGQLTPGIRLFRQFAELAA